MLEYLAGNHSWQKMGLKLCWAHSTTVLKQHSHHGLDAVDEGTKKHYFGGTVIHSMSNFFTTNDFHDDFFSIVIITLN